jgi:peptide/nickel transport system ATP-binding protein
MSLVALESIRVQFPVGRRTLTAVADVSLAIAPGETLALVGESGSGKSTIGNVIAGLQRPTAGVMRFGGRALDKATTTAARRAIQIIFQDPFGALDPRMPVSAIIAEPLLIQHLGTRAERLARAADLAEQVGLPADALNRYPHEFSGGQRQRIAIARALAPDPALIVADEPLSALDVSIQSQILNLLADLRRVRGLAYLFISHDLAVVNHLADRVAVLYLGRLVEVAPREALFATPSHPYTQALLEAMPRIGRRRRTAVIQGEMPSALDPPSGCVFHTRCPKAQAVCRMEVPQLEPAPGRPEQRAACHFRA